MRGTEMTVTKKKTLSIVLCGMFAALITVGAYIKFHIGVVPFTMQVFFVILAGMILGGKYGSVSVLVYIVTGLVGIPVFTDGGGIWYFLNPKFGYIIGFAIAAFVTGKIAFSGKRRYLRYFAAGMAGIAIIYFVGVIYYWAISYFYLGKSLSFAFLMKWCFLITLPGDIVSCVLAAFVADRTHNAINL